MEAVSSHRSSRRERALVIAAVMIGTISTILAATIVNVAFPAMMREMHIGHDTVQWVGTGFLAATTSTMLATAWLTERFGERATFLLVLAAFLAASILGALAWNVESLITARVLQGAAAGILQPLGMIALFRVFPAEERGRAMGFFGMGVVLAPAIGPAIGGALVDAFGWRSIFLLTVPFCIAGLFIGRIALPARRIAVRPAKFDWVGTLLLILALVTLLNIPVWGHREGWLAPLTIALAVLGVVLTASFIAWQLRSREALLAVRLFEHASFRGAALVAFAYGAGLFGSTYLVPVFVQDIAHFDAARAGSLLAPAGIALAIAMTVGGRLTDRSDARMIVVVGLALFALSSLLLAFSGATTGFWLLALWLVVGRLGLGMVMPALNVGAVQAFTGPDLAYASSAVNFVRQLGGAVGVNVLAVLLEWRIAVHGPGDAVQAFHECFAVVTLAFALAIVPARSIRKPRR